MPVFNLLRQRGAMAEAIGIAIPVGVQPVNHYSNVNPLLKGFQRWFVRGRNLTGFLLLSLFHSYEPLEP